MRNREIRREPYFPIPQIGGGMDNPLVQSWTSAGPWFTNGKSYSMFKTKCQLLPSIFKMYIAQTQRVLFVLSSFSFWGVSDVSSSFLSLGGKETRKGEWVGWGPMSFSVTAFLSDMAPYFLHFYLQWVYVNTLDISEYSAKTVEPANLIRK